MPVTRFAQDNRELRDRFKTEFADLFPDVRVIWENQPADGGDNQSPFPALDEEFVRLVIRQYDARQVSINKPSRAFRNYGTVFVYIQTEANKGSARNETIADNVGQALGAVTVGGIILRDPVYRVFGVTEHQWFQAVVSTPYQSTFLE